MISSAFAGKKVYAADPGYQIEMTEYYPQLFDNSADLSLEFLSHLGQCLGV